MRSTREFFAKMDGLVGHTTSCVRGGTPPNHDA